MKDFTKLDKQVKQEAQVPIADNKVAKNEDFHGTLFEPFANKDNFWNSIFALGMILGSITIGFIFSLIIMVLILKRFSKVTFIDGKVFNSQNKELSIRKQMPSGVLVILTTVAGTAFIDKTFNSYLNSLPDTLSVAIIISCFIIIPTLFFILKNCPISILFNYTFYKTHGQNAFVYNPRVGLYKSGDFRNSNASNLNNHNNDYRYNPTYSSYPGNIYHRKK